MIQLNMEKVTKENANMQILIFLSSDENDVEFYSRCNVLVQTKNGLTEEWSII